MQTYEKPLYSKNTHNRKFLHKIDPWKRKRILDLKQYKSLNKQNAAPIMHRNKQKTVNKVLQ